MTKYLGDMRWECGCGRVIDYPPITTTPDPEEDGTCYECLPFLARLEYLNLMIGDGLMTENNPAVPRPLTCPVDFGGRILFWADLSDEIHQANVEAGWYTDLDSGLPLDRDPQETLALVHSELSEALEGFRKSLPDDKLPHRRMVEVELADAAIRMMDTVGWQGWSGTLRQAVDTGDAETAIWEIESLRGGPRLTDNLTSIPRSLSILHVICSGIADDSLSAERMEGTIADYVADLFRASCVRDALKFLEGVRMVSGTFCYDLFGAIEEKLEFNRTREDHSLEARRGVNGKKI